MKNQPLARNQSHQRPPPTGGDNHSLCFIASMLTYKSNMPVPAPHGAYILQVLNRPFVPVPVHYAEALLSFRMRYPQTFQSISSLWGTGPFPPSVANGVGRVSNQNPYHDQGTSCYSLVARAVISSLPFPVIVPRRSMVSVRPIPSRWSASGAIRTRWHRLRSRSVLVFFTFLLKLLQHIPQLVITQVHLQINHQFGTSNPFFVILLVQITLRFAQIRTYFTTEMIC